MAFVKHQQVNSPFGVVRIDSALIMAGDKCEYLVKTRAGELRRVDVRDIQPLIEMPMLPARAKGA